METVSSAPTIKQRRKFERIETSNMNNQDTSSVNHVSDVYEIGKLSKYMDGEVQMLADCCKESIKKCFWREKNEHRRFSDPISIRKNQPEMKKILLYGIAAAPQILFLVAFSITYTICILESHADAGFLYISDTAIDYPESSIATQALNMIAITVFLIMLLRVLVLQQYLGDFSQKGIQKTYVIIMFWTSLLVLFSIQIIGNFPAVNVSNVTLHFTAVVIFFVSSMGYCITDTKITYHTIGVLSDRHIYYLRFTLSVVLLISAFSAFVPGLISWQQFDGENYRKWKPTDGGWTYHVISVIAEWLYVFSANLYMFFLAYEFRIMTFYVPVVKIKYLTIKEKIES